MLSGLEVVENDNFYIRDAFEACVAYLIPIDLVSRNEVKTYFKKIIGTLVAAVLFDPKLNKGKFL